jgi:hypothetical protein
MQFIGKFTLYPFVYKFGASKVLKDIRGLSLGVQIYTKRFLCSCY